MALLRCGEVARRRMPSEATSLMFLKYVAKTMVMDYVGTVGGCCASRGLPLGPPSSSSG
jgi:hypothetical protein